MGGRRADRPHTRGDVLKWTLARRGRGGARWSLRMTRATAWTRREEWTLARTVGGGRGTRPTSCSSSGQTRCFGGALVLYLHSHRPFLAPHLEIDIHIYQEAHNLSMEGVREGGWVGGGGAQEGGVPFPLLLPF